MKKARRLTGLWQRFGLLPERDPMGGVPPYTCNRGAPRTGLKNVARLALRRALAKRDY